DGENLAAGDVGIIGWVKGTRRALSQKTVVLRAFEVVQESVFKDHHLVEVKCAQLLGPVVPHVADLQYVAFHFVLNAKAVLLHVGSNQVRIGNAECRGRIERVVVRERTGDFERGRGYGWKNGRQPYRGTGFSK